MLETILQDGTHGQIEDNEHAPDCEDAASVVLADRDPQEASAPKEEPLEGSPQVPVNPASVHELVEPVELFPCIGVGRIGGRLGNPQWRFDACGFRRK